MIINLRGTNGSGKSTVARGLMALDTRTRVINLAPSGQKGFMTTYVQGYHIPKLDMVVVGLYKTDCGGCDGIKTQELVHESVKYAAKFTEHVFFEGVIVSTIFSSYLRLSKELRKEGKPFVWAYLDTPVELCLERVYKRNDGEELKLDKATHSEYVRFGKPMITTVERKINTIASTRNRASQAGELVFPIPHTNAVEAILELIKNG